MGRNGFFVLCAFLWAGKGHDFRVGGMRGAPVFPTIDDLLALLHVFVGIVEEFEEIRGFGLSESGCSGVVLVWVILAR